MLSEIAWDEISSASRLSCQAGSPRDALALSAGTSPHLEPSRFPWRLQSGYQFEQSSSSSACGPDNPVDFFRGELVCPGSLRFLADDSQDVGFGSGEARVVSNAERGSAGIAASLLFFRH